MELALQTSGDFSVLTQAVRWAESHGLAALALPDHYYTPAGGPMYDAFVQLGGLAAITDHIELVLLVSPVTFRHPAVVAKAAATLNDIAPGRFALGLGTGWLEVEHDVLGLAFPDRRTRFALLEEQLQYVRSALADHEEGFSGDHYQLGDVLLRPPAPDLRLVVGGTGRHRTPDLAGRYADEFNAYPGPDLGERIGRMRRATIDAGRPDGAVRVSSAGAVFCAADEASYRAKLERVAQEAGTSVETIEHHFKQRNTPRGTAAEVRAELRSIADLGVSRFYVQTFDDFDMDRETETLELLGVL